MRRESTVDPREVGYLTFVSLPVMGLVMTSVALAVVEWRRLWSDRGTLGRRAMWKL